MENTSMWYEAEGDNYVLMEDGEECDFMEEIAICYDRCEGLLVLFGEANMLEQWYHDQCQQTTDLGYPGFAEDTILIRGKFDIDTINRIITEEHYVAKWLKEERALFGEVEGVKTITYNQSKYLH